MARGHYMVTWRELITREMGKTGDTWSDVESCTLDDAGLDVQFDDGYGGENGAPFTLWTRDYVYFPCAYDGAEWCGSVPRNPCDVATEHIG